MSHCTPVHLLKESGILGSVRKERNKKWTRYYRKSSHTLVCMSDQKWMRIVREENITVIAKSFCLSVYFTSRYSEAWGSVNFYVHGAGSGNWGGVIAAIAALQWSLVYWELAHFLTAVCAGLSHPGMVSANARDTGLGGYWETSWQPTAPQRE